MPAARGGAALGLRQGPAGFFPGGISIGLQPAVRENFPNRDNFIDIRIEGA